MMRDSGRYSHFPRIRLYTTATSSSWKRNPFVRWYEHERFLLSKTNSWPPRAFFGRIWSRFSCRAWLSLLPQVVFSCSPLIYGIDLWVQRGFAVVMKTLAGYKFQDKDRNTKRQSLFFLVVHTPYHGDRLVSFVDCLANFILTMLEPTSGLQSRLSVSQFETHFEILRIKNSQPLNSFFLNEASIFTHVQYKLLRSWIARRPWMRCALLELRM